MEITFVARKLNLQGGGSNQSLKLVLDEVSTYKCVNLITINSSENNFGQLNCNLIEHNVSRSRMAEIKAVKQILQNHETDIFHVFNPGLLPAAGLYRRQGKTPVVGRLNTYNLFCTNTNRMRGECFQNCKSTDKMRHDNSEPLKKPLKIPEYLARTHAVPELVNQVDALFALSPAVKRIYESNGYDSITVIPNFYNPELTDGITTNNEISSPPTDYLFVGRLIELKGVDVLIDAARELHPEVTIHIVGDGPERQRLEKQSKQNDTGAEIIFHGWVEHEQLPEYYTDCDVMVHPGRLPEPFGRTILEALQFGVPCIVSDTGAPPWIVDDAGLSFESENPTELAEKINKLSTSPKLFSDLKDRTDKQLERFTRERTIETLLEEYKRVTELV